MAKPLRVHSTALPAPPGHLSGEAKDWWGRIVREYGISDEAGLLLLQSAMESWDRVNECRVILKKEGLTVKDKYEQHRPHPAAGIERDSRKAMLAALKDLRLDVEPLRPGPGRPPG